MKQLLPILFGSLLLPSPVSAALEGSFVYFPTAELVTTPAAVGLAYEDVFFTAADGTALHGWYLPGEPGRPLLVFCHGNAGNISHRVDNLRLLRELGLTVFIFDYRGYGRSSGTPSEAGTYSDLRGALVWLQQKGWKQEQMVYFGRSLGAAVALQLALEEPPAALILESPFTSIGAMGRHHSPLLWLLGGWLLNTRYDSLGKISDLRVPLMILHGDEDEIVPQQMGRQLFERAPQPKRFHSLPGAGHNNSYEVGGEAYRNWWREFLTEIR
ncbi:alpha/beta hydrolase [Geothermobacter hydrogeniphilus]|uniref:Serine aminopeptidase S33 domain-containing protein n=1 Tax=Geothermobacter hydrogeniphilus TaxID=1969733 RepID=A0A1X0Y904_9BACT|nr:alpha/beta hydrolase [Geothermobacter hydrogeniphilus]ORJ61616.1 hypothetical protein B5V00_06170 [Geothermobacter hydrogeniphilus]